MNRFIVALALFFAVPAFADDFVDKMLAQAKETGRQEGKKEKLELKKPEAPPPAPHRSPAPKPPPAAQPSAVAPPPAAMSEGAPARNHEGDSQGVSGGRAAKVYVHGNVGLGEEVTDVLSTLATGLLAHKAIERAQEETNKVAAKAEEAEAAAGEVFLDIKEGYNRSVAAAKRARQNKINKSVPCVPATAPCEPKAAAPPPPCDDDDVTPGQPKRKIDFGWYGELGIGGNYALSRIDSGGLVGTIELGLTKPAPLGVRYEIGTLWFKVGTSQVRLTHEVDVLFRPHQNFYLGGAYKGAVNTDATNSTKTDAYHLYGGLLGIQGMVTDKVGMYLEALVGQRSSNILADGPVADVRAGVKWVF